MRTIEVFNYTSTRYFRRERIVSLWFSFFAQKHMEPEKMDVKEIRFRLLSFLTFCMHYAGNESCACVCESMRERMYNELRSHEL